VPPTDINIEGVTLNQETLSKIRELTRRLRIDLLIKQRDLIWEHLSGNKPIEMFFNKAGVVIVERQLHSQVNWSQ
jgi:hypothetical protein